VGFFQVANREHLSRIIRGNGVRAFVFCGARIGRRDGGGWRAGAAGTRYAKMR
jgi:hypothetical protein